MSINRLSYIDPNATIGQNVTVSPFAYIEDDVVIGDNTWIGPSASIMSGTRIGNNCKVFQGAILGSVPQDLKYKGERTSLIIGDNVVIREFCTINKGTTANFSTEIHNNCLIMAYVHIAHDCIVNEGCILANNVNLAGHIEIGKNAILGGLTAVHQFVKIGEHVMVGGGSLVRKDIPPFITAAREPLTYSGVNKVGLKRRGFSSQQVENIKDIYRVLFIKGYNTTQAIEVIQGDFPFSSERDSILGFLRQADRGIIKSFRPQQNGHVKNGVTQNQNGSHKQNGKHENTDN